MGDHEGSEAPLGSCTGLEGGDALAGLSAAVAAIGATDRTRWSCAARSSELEELLAARERLDATVLVLTGEWEAQQAWALDGARSPVAWLAHHAPLTRQEASTLVRSARLLHGHPDTAAALVEGEITTSHVDLAGRAARHREPHYTEHEVTLLQVAQDLPPAAFRIAVQHWAHCVDAVFDPGPSGSAGADGLGNHLDAHATFGGVGHLEGRLDPVAFTTLVRRLDALEPPDPTVGTVPPRSLARRRADALMRLVHGDVGPARVAVDVIVDVDTLAGRPSPDPTGVCCELGGFGPVSPDLVRTLACDGAIGRILMRGKSEVLDLGRRTRLVSTAQRRMLVIRDRTCTEPGCDVPGAWCDAHHVVPWWSHGPTDATNLRLRCRHHHLLDHLRTARARGDPARYPLAS